MKTIEIFCDRLSSKVYIYFAWTIQDAIDLFKIQHPAERITFVQDAKFKSITKHFQNGSNEVPKG